MPAQASGLSLHSSAFTLEIGLSFGVYYHHFGIKLEKAARQDDRFQFCSEMVRAARIELASLAWKAGILAIIRRPLNYTNNYITERANLLFLFSYNS